MNTNDEEIRLLNLELLATLLFLVATIISILTTYNSKKNLENKNVLFNQEEQYKINVFNRIFTIFLVILFFYINIENRKIAQLKNKNLRPFELQITISSILLLAAFLSLYVVLINGQSNVSNIENPTI